MSEIKSIIQHHKLIDQSVTFLSQKIDEISEKIDEAVLNNAPDEVFEMLCGQMRNLLAKCKSEMKELDKCEEKLKALKLLK